MSDNVEVALRETMGALASCAPDSPELPHRVTQGTAWWRSQQMFAFAAAAVVVVVAVGVAALIFRGGTEPADVVTTITETPATTEALASTTVTLPTTTSAVVVTAPPVMDWRHIALPGVGEVATVVVTEAGLVAGGELDGSAMLWQSADGVTWTEMPPISSSPDVLLEGSVGDIVEGADRSVALIGDGVWYSTDLEVWTRTDGQPFTGDGQIDLRAVTYGPSGFVVVGYEAEPDNEAMISRGIMWHSPDGMTWTRIEDPALDRVAAYDVAFHDGRYIAVGIAWIPSPLHEGIWTSTDGQEWIAIDRSDHSGGTWMEGVTSSPNGVYAIGHYSPGFAMPEQEGTGCVAIWHSPNPEVWTRIGEQDEALCGDLHGSYGYAIAAHDDRIVGVGESLPKSPAASQAGLWASRDLGTSWDQIAQPSAVFGVDANAYVTMHDIVIVEDTYVAVGVYDSTPAIWIGSWEE